MSRPARALPFLLLLLAPLGYALGCGNSGTDAGTGGAGPSSGGTVGSGGGTPGTGGAPTTGGAANTGGAPTTGGAANTGGAATTGGAANTGGAPTTGGAPGTGGAQGGTRVPGTDAYDCSAASGTVPTLEVVELESGLVDPIYVTHPPNDDRLFVIEQDGAIAIIEDGALVPTRFLEFQDKVYSDNDGAFNEKGFLGLAFHPDYANNGLFYVHYSAQASGTPDTGDANGDTTISEFQVSSDPNVADADSERIVMSLAHPQVNHNGGSITFGSDGMLYIGLGDGGGSNDPDGNGQNPDTLFGKILRIDPLEAGGEAYTSPAGNLPDGAPEVWDYGLRNPYRFNFDACTGAMYIGDVGQDAWEEVNVELAGVGHHNYGWDIMEGAHCRTGGSCDMTGMVMPIAEYAHENDEGRTVVGGAVYRGADIPALRGAYFYMDAYQGEIWYLFYDEASGDVTGPTPVSLGLAQNALVVAIQNGPDGELLFVARGEGAIYQLTAP